MISFFQTKCFSNGDTRWPFPFGGFKGGCKEYQGGVLIYSQSGEGRLTVSPTHRRFVSVHSINSCVSENCKDVRHEWDTEQTDWDLQHVSITSICGPKTTKGQRVKIWSGGKDRPDKRLQLLSCWTIIIIFLKLHISFVKFKVGLTNYFLHEMIKAEQICHWSDMFWIYRGSKSQYSSANLYLAVFIYK